MGVVGSYSSLHEDEQSTEHLTSPFNSNYINKKNIHIVGKRETTNGLVF